MNAENLEKYHLIRGGNPGFIEKPRGLIEVSGAEAVQFLNGLITNDVAKLESYRWTLAAFPNAQGRLLAIVRVLRLDEKFLFETEEATREKVFQNLFRFTFAGDFFVEDLSENFSYLSVFGTAVSNFKYPIPTEKEIIGAQFDDGNGFLMSSVRAAGFDIFLPKASKEYFVRELLGQGTVEISAELDEILRVENGIPLYGVDMSDATIVPEIGLPELISYQKGCYIGQEIIARIHFRGHVAKELRGLIFESEPEAAANALSASSELAGKELKTPDDKNAGRITSAVFSPKLAKTIALAFVRYDYLAEGTKLKIGDLTVRVKTLPFIE